MPRILLLIGLITLSFSISTFGWSPGVQDKGTENIPNDSTFDLQTNDLFYNTLSRTRLVYISGMRGTSSFRVSIADSIVPLLVNRKAVVTREVPDKATSHDMNIVAGRAAWFLEGVTGMQLPRVHAELSNDELQKIHQQATLYLSAYRRGMLEVSEESGMGRRNLPDLLKRYQGKIDTVKTMHNFLREWFPLGKRIEELDLFWNRKPDIENGVRKYGISYGYYGTLFYFIIEDSVIVDVFSETYS